MIDSRRTRVCQTSPTVVGQSYGGLTGGSEPKPRFARFVRHPPGGAYASVITSGCALAPRNKTLARGGARCVRPGCIL
jgi:hypothetical protein